MNKKYFLYKEDLDSDIDFKDKIISIDTETTGLDLNHNRLCLIQLSDIEGNSYLIKYKKGSFQSPNLLKFLSDPSYLKIFHFARFDVAILMKSFDVSVKNIFCTKIASKLARTYSSSHSLKVLVKEVLNFDLSKECQSSDWGDENLSEEQIYYAINDVIFLYDIKKYLEKILLRENKLDIAYTCFSFIESRCKLDLLGFKSDIFIH